MAGDGGTLPTPDPTILTTEQLLREVTQAKELMLTAMRGDRALANEKLQSIAMQLSLIERQRVEQKADTEKAVQAALSAAKEAVKEQTAASEKSITKSETATAEQLRQLTATFATAIEGVSTSLGDVKERVGKVEAIRVGVSQRAGDSRASIGTVVGIIGASAAATGTIALLLSNHP